MWMTYLLQSLSAVEENMLVIAVTRDTSHLLTSVLKLRAPSNVYIILDTRDVSQFDMSPLNASAW